MEKKTAVIVDGDDGEKQVAIGVEKKARRHERGNARDDAVVGLFRHRPHGDIVKAEIGFLGLDARRGVTLHMRGLLGKIEFGPACGFERRGMKHRQMGGIDQSLEDLNEAAADDGIDRKAM